MWALTLFSALVSKVAALCLRTFGWYIAPIVCGSVPRVVATHQLAIDNPLTIIQYSLGASSRLVSDLCISDSGNTHTFAVSIY